MKPIYAKIIILIIFALLIYSGIWWWTTLTKTKPFNPEVQQQNQNVVGSKTELSECEKAGGELQKRKECDGSENDHCILSEKIHCYADLVKNGKCDVEFSEKWFNETGDGMVGPGSGPRVWCDDGEFEP